MSSKPPRHTLSRDSNPNIALIQRRRALGALCAIGAAGSITRFASPTIAATNAASAACTLSPSMTEGPYWVDEGLRRFDVTEQSALAAIAQAVPLYLYIHLVDANCAPLSGVQVDIWHCHAAGSYSDENQASNGASTLGQRWLRGNQISSASGSVYFKTIYPGWYRGRTTHIHVRARYFDAVGNTTYNFTTQLFFDDTISDTVFASAPYVVRGQGDTSNASDMVYSGGGSTTLLALTKTDSGAYTGAATLSLNLATSADEIWQTGFE